MAYILDLSGCWAKLERAKGHVDQLCAEIERAGAPDFRIVPLRREYDREERAVVYRVERVIEVQPHWPLIVGDAVHNFRCALDHLAWQLALRKHDGTEPKTGLAKRVQFPIVSDPKKWPGQLTDWLSREDIAALAAFEPMEPYYRRKRGFNHGLEGLAALSNIDKHRTIHVMRVVRRGLSITNQGFIDCVPDARPAPNGSLVTAILAPETTDMRPDDEVLRVFVTPTGPNPNVEFDPYLFCYIAIHEPTWEALGMLDLMHKGIAAILRRFEAAP